MPKLPAESKKSGLARPDRAVLQARKEAALRTEELKLKLMVLTEKYFDQSLRIIKSWLADRDSSKKR